MQWYIQALKKFTDFSGRAQRMEYWMFTLTNDLIFILIWLFSVAGIAKSGAVLGVGMIFGSMIILPTIAVQVRRLHDTNRSGLWVLISLIPYVGTVILFTFSFLDSTPGQNQYGTNPKDISE